MIYMTRQEGKARLRESAKYTEPTTWRTANRIALPRKREILTCERHPNSAVTPKRPFPQAFRAPRAAN